MKKAILSMICAAALVAPPAAAETTLRYLCYGDANECEVGREILDQFERENPGIKVVIDKVDYNAVLESLPVQLEAGEGPDIARVTRFGELQRHFLDLRELVKDPAYWEKNFGGTLQWLRRDASDKGVYGWQEQFTITGPFVNRTLFEQAGVALPKQGATWDDWAEASRAVRDKLGLYAAMAMDRSGHRFAGPAMSMGAKYFDSAGRPQLIDDGFKAMAERMVQWHKDGTMPADIWPAASGGKWKNAVEMFANADVPFYMTGSWTIQGWADKVGDDFDWQAVPNPCGPAGCSPMPGGAAVVAFKYTKHPEAVARLMDFMVSEPVIREYTSKTLQIPAHAGLASSEIQYQSDNPAVAAALSIFTREGARILPPAYQLQGYPHNGAIYNTTVSRLSQAITGELTLDQAYARIAEDIEQALKEAGE